MHYLLILKKEQKSLTQSQNLQNNFLKGGKIECPTPNPTTKTQ